MRFLSRFERRVVFSILMASLAPLVAAVILGRVVLREAYLVGVRPEIARALEAGLERRRAEIVAVREQADRATALFADHYAVRRALEHGSREELVAALRSIGAGLDDVQTVGLRGRGLDVQVVIRPDTALSSHQRTREVTTDGGPVVIAVTFATPSDLVVEYHRAGELARTFGHLVRNPDYYSSRYLLGYLLVLMLLIVAALVLVLGAARKATAHVIMLAQATRRVGSGDLEVTVDTPGNYADEVSDLARAFNQMVRDLRESRRRIEYLQRIGAWQEFARRLAHEIKNPLTPIQLAVQEIHQSYRGDDEKYRAKLGEARAIVEEEVATLRRMVGEFSSFAKLPTATLESADLGDFVRDLERSMDALLEDLHADPGRVVFSVLAPAAPLPVKLDGMMLKRAVDNLIRNAAQAILAEPGRRGRVTVEAREAEDAFLILEIRDDGPGIPSEQRERVFEPYFTTKSDGTGLGLAIVKKVVLEHGGEVSCQSSPEGGASFCIRLPRGALANMTTVQLGPSP